MGQMVNTWGFGKKKTPVQFEVKNVETPHFKERVLLSLELEVDYPVDVDLLEVLQEKAKVNFTLPENISINSVELDRLEVRSQAVFKK